VRRWQALQWHKYTRSGSPVAITRREPQWHCPIRSMVRPHLIQRQFGRSSWVPSSRFDKRRFTSYPHWVEHSRNISRRPIFSRFPPDARWNSERSVVEFSIGVGEYEGVVRVSRRVFQILLPEAPTPERCLEAYHLHRTRLELIAERKVRQRQLTDAGNIEITGRDLRDR
jgi:Protein of unknown function (DUF1488)